MHEFHLPTMSCGHCVKRISESLQRADPLCELRFDLPARQLQIISTAPRPQLAEWLAAAGYPPA